MLVGFQALLATVVYGADSAHTNISRFRKYCELPARSRRIAESVETVVSGAKGIVVLGVFCDNDFVSMIDAIAGEFEPVRLEILILSESKTNAILSDTRELP